MNPPNILHIHEMDKAREDCYYFKKMNEFVVIIQTR